MRQFLLISALSGRLTKRFISFQKNSGFLLLISILFLTAMQLTANAQNIRYVKVGATGSGASWATASGNLQDMINASGAGDKVWVAAGTYYPSSYPDGCLNCGADNRDYAFGPKSNVAVYGGFSGIETALTQRNTAH